MSDAPVTGRRVIGRGSRRGLGRPFWRLFASSATSNLADGIGRTAFPLLGASLTRDPLLISGLATLSFLPWLLFALPAGAMVDRSDRRRAMAAANMCRALVVGALGVAVLAGAGSILVLYVAAFLVGAAETVYDSAARAMLPGVIAKDRLDDGNGLLVTEEMVGQTFLGAPLGAFLFALLAAAPLVTNAVGFALAAVLVLGVHGGRRPERAASTTIRADIAEGLRFLRADRLLFGLMLVSAGVVGASALADGVLVLYVLQDLDVPAAGFGLFVLGAGVGGVLGGLVSGRISARLGRTGALATATAVAGSSYLVMGVVDVAWIGAVLFGLFGFAVIVWNVPSMSVRQALIPTGLFGRVQGAWRTLVWGIIPLASLGGGLLASATSVRTVFLVSGAAQILGAPAVWLVLRAHRERLHEAFAVEPSIV